MGVIFLCMNGLWVSVFSPTPFLSGEAWRRSPASRPAPASRRVDFAGSLRKTFEISNLVSLGVQQTEIRGPSQWVAGNAKGFESAPPKSGLALQRPARLAVRTLSRVRHWCVSVRITYLLPLSSEGGQLQFGTGPTRLLVNARLAASPDAVTSHLCTQVLGGCWRVRATGLGGGSGATTRPV